MLLLWVKLVFLQKNAIFSKQNASISKIKEIFVLKVLKLDMCIYLRTKFQVSSIILTIFRQDLGGG